MRPSSDSKHQRHTRPLHTGRITEMGWQQGHGGASTGVMALRLRLDGPAGPLTVWLRDSLGLAKPAIALTISLGAGATVPARCLLPQPAAFTTPLRAGAERTVLVQCRDAFGNPAPRGRDQVA